MSARLAALAAFVIVAQPAAAQDKLGVAACDDVLAKYEACVATMPSGVQQVAKLGIEQMRATWKGLAANPQAVADLSDKCSQLGEGFKASLAQFNCKW